MPETLIDYYRAIESGSARMLEAARSEDWDEVVRCEEVCVMLIEQLRRQAQAETLSPTDRKEKAHIMQRILHNDAQIRYLTEPWLEGLGSETGLLVRDSRPPMLH